MNPKKTCRVLHYSFHILPTLQHIAISGCSDTRKSKNGFKVMLNKAFLYFFAYIFDDFSKFRRAFGILHFEKSANMPSKNWQK